MFLLERPVCDVEIGEANSDENEQEEEEEEWPEAAALCPVDELLCLIQTVVVALAVVSCVGQLATGSKCLFRYRIFQN